MTSERNETGGAEDFEGAVPDEQGGDGAPATFGGPAASTEPAEGGAGDDLESLRQEVLSLRDRHLRLAAEFENYRKRSERERADAGIRAQGQLVRSLLEAVDDLERVADFTEETTTVTALLEGVQMVERKLLRALETAGLERLEARGEPFDPNQHEALMTADTEHPHEDETVGDVFQKGYRFQGHLLRPARVQVRKHGG